MRHPLPPFPIPIPLVPAWLKPVLALLPRGITLSAALSLSLLAHALLLAIHFQVPDKLAQASQQALEIILVNAKSATRPHDAQARAQANLDGGGNTEQKRIAKTPLPATQPIAAWRACLLGGHVRTAAEGPTEHDPTPSRRARETSWSKHGARSPKWKPCSAS